MSGKFKPKYTRVAQLKTAADLRKYLEDGQVDLDFDDELIDAAKSPFAESLTLKSGKLIGNRFCILPMEGWDGTKDGKPSEYTKRRWENFAISGAKLLWGCEAAAVRHDGRANPNQLLINEENLPEFEALFQMVMSKHAEKFGSTDDLVVGLQLTHSGRFCKPNSHTKFESKILYNHPILDKKYHLGENYPLMTDDEIDALVKDFVKAAVLAQKAGFHFVDLKHCHGYLGHEFLSSFNREGKYGGSFENRTRFLRNIVEGIKKEAPGLEMGIRLSAFDWVPFKKDSEGQGEPDYSAGEKYHYAFGGTGQGTTIDLEEPKAFLALAQELGIQLICITVGSPYYNPHLMRPATFPPSDGYYPPEEPFLGVARQINVTNELKQAFPELVIVGSAYSYAQDWLPNVGQYVLRNNMADFIGLGRMVLSYPTLPDDVLNNRPMQRKLICRTFSDCTTAPRNGLISGCFPLDPIYKNLDIADTLKKIKEQQ
ncbi:NADH:flavin oxidoreductase [Emticicia sp. BO119]|uniref:oxidoreductase n=1 Tax=Emticicia sp. BO119 TaxID=2757768 RepID=UPI0015F03ED9|nr:NADH:flavin oxidoreductase [Emticicia sp. BO119]MBA4849612.1 NADH:flavin oxidoreductase [Emticicia sp. BO119]